MRRRREGRPGPAGHQDDDRRHDHRHRTGEVAHHLEVGAADVRLVRWASRSRHSGTAFATRPTTRRRASRPTRPRAGRTGRCQAWTSTNTATAEEQNRVHQRCEDLESQVAEGPVDLSRAAAGPDRAGQGRFPRRRSACGPQRRAREAAPEQGADDLDQEHRQRDREHRHEAAAMGGGGRAVRVGHQARRRPGAGQRGRRSTTWPVCARSLVAGRVRRNRLGAGVSPPSAGCRCDPRPSPCTGGPCPRSARTSAGSRPSITVMPCARPLLVAFVGRRCRSRRSGASRHGFDAELGAFAHGVFSATGDGEGVAMTTASTPPGIDFRSW